MSTKTIVSKGMKAAVAANPKQPRRMDRVARREQLTACALSVYADHGIAGATHTEVAARAKVSIPTVFAYFPSKDDLTDAVLTEVESLLWGIVDRIRGATTDVPTTFFDNYLRFTNVVETCPDHIRIWLVWGTAINDPHWARYVKLQDRMINANTRVLRKGQVAGSIDTELDVRDAARMLVANSHMVALMIFSGINAAGMRRYIQHLLESALSLRPAGAGPLRGTVSTPG